MKYVCSTYLPSYFFYFIIKLANSGCSSFTQNNLKYVLVVGGQNTTNKAGNSVFLSAIDGKETRVVNNVLLEVSKKL